MTEKAKNMTRKKTDRSRYPGRAVSLLLLLLCFSSGVFAQVISNNGAAMTVSPGAAVVSGDLTNTFTVDSARLHNNGTINLSGNLTNNIKSRISGDGTLRLKGHWTNAGKFRYDLSTVVFNGSAEQIITGPGAETFYNFSLENTGTTLSTTVRLANPVQVMRTLYMKSGNITASGSNKLFLWYGVPSALNYTAVSSKVYGLFERGVWQQGDFLFPLGNISRPSFYNPAHLITNVNPVSGSVLTEFITSPAPGNAGLPIADLSVAPNVEVDSTYTTGYWSMTARNSFSVSDYSVTLTAAGFANSTDTVRDITRVVKRTGSGNWTLDGTHSDATGETVKRNNLTGNISPSGTQFALARANPLITGQPASLIVCEMTYPSFTVIASGAGPLTYAWYKDGVRLDFNDPHYTGVRSSTLVINEAVLTDAGDYYCVVRDRYRNTTISTSANLIVNKIPRARMTPDAQNHECSNVSFDDILIEETYGVPGTTYLWERTNPAGISSPTIPLSGSGLNIGDVFSGLFINVTDAPITVTFTIIPVGPAPTYCTGLPVTATVTVNPRPRIIPVVKQMCYGENTLIELVSPSIMTQPNTIRFDYNITATAPVSVVGGNRSSASNVAYGTVLSFPYTNSSDTSQSVYFNVTATVPALGCPSGIETPMETKVHAKPLQNLIITEPLTCDGGSNADLRAVTSRGAGGTTGYYFDWTRTQLDQAHGYNLENLVNRRGGRWDVTVTDNLNCKSSGYIFVSGAKLDSYMYVPVDPASGFATTCTGSSDGAIWLMETNSSTGIAPFEYWITRNGQDTASTALHGNIINKEEFSILPGLSAGNYKLYIKDKNGCYNVSYPQVDIMEPPQITVTFETRKYDGDYDISCKGYNDGRVSIKTIEGGNGGYRYKWTTINGSITGIDTLSTLDNITAGKYFLHTTDIKGCTKIDSVTLYEPDGMILSSSQVSLKPDGTYNISCNGGSDGSVDITVTGGSGSYKYSWSGPGGFIATTEDISGLQAGVYNCTVQDLNGCMLAPAPSFTLNAPPVIALAATKSVSPDGGYNINCYGGTGSVDINVTGGIPGTYQYFWSTADGSGIVQGQEDQSSLSAGSYMLKVRDINGCEDSISVTLTQPLPLTLSFREKNITCASGVFNDGSIDLTVSGGASPYSYAWSNGSAGEDISDLTEGTYTVTVTDFNGCPATGSARVVNPPPLTYTSAISNYNDFNISCFGMSNGSINITTTSGTAPYIFTWTGPDGFVSSTPGISGLKAGTYILNITDSLACHVSETFELKEPGQLGMTLSMSSSLAGGFNINCAGDRTGYIGVEPLNNVRNVEYLWSDGLFGKTRNNLPAGEYSVIITDANNCYASATVELTEPDSMKISFVVTQPFCPDMPNGSVLAEVKGGVPAADYYYRWSDNSTDKALTDITAGFYSLTVRDLNGCVVKDSLFVEPQNESCLIIPNAISPNGDLINDEWNIENIDLYPEAEVKIFNRWGINIWKSARGYPQPWNGRRGSKALPIDSYHYIIDLHNGRKPVIGTVTIVR